MDVAGNVSPRSPGVSAGVLTRPAITHSIFSEPSTIIQGNGFLYTLNAAANPGPPAFTTLSGPPGMTLTRFAGPNPLQDYAVVQWQPTAAQLGTFSFTVSASNPNTTGASVTYSVTVLPNGTDTVPPTPVAQLTASGISFDHATLSWTAAGDNIGIANYHIVATHFGVPNQVLTLDVPGANLTTPLTALLPAAGYVFTMPPQPPQPPVLPVINIYALDAEGAEVASGAPNIASFRVTHDFPATAPVGFMFAMGGSAREGVDYTLSPSAGVIASGFLGRWFSFARGTTEAIIEVNPIHDLLIENTETATMSLYTPPFIGFPEGGFNGWDPGTFGFYYGTSPSATVSILDIDTAPPVWTVEASTDLVNWEVIGTTDPSGESGDFVDVSVGDFPSRFYRFVPIAPAAQ